MRKVENAGDQHCLPFATFFSTPPKKTYLLSESDVVFHLQTFSFRMNIIFRRLVQKENARSLLEQFEIAKIICPSLVMVTIIQTITKIS